MMTAMMMMGHSIFYSHNPPFQGWRILLQEGSDFLVKGAAKKSSPRIFFKGAAKKSTLRIFLLQGRQ